MLMVLLINFILNILMIIDVLQSKRFYFDKAYTHKKDYYKIVGQFDENRKNYRFYLYEPYWPLYHSDSVNKDTIQTKNVTININ